MRLNLCNVGCLVGWNSYGDAIADTRNARSLSCLGSMRWRGSNCMSNRPFHSFYPMTLFCALAYGLLLQYSVGDVKRQASSVLPRSNLTASLTQEGM